MLHLSQTLNYIDTNTTSTATGTATCSLHNSTLTDGCENPPSTATNVVISVIVGVFFVVGSTGNIITMWVLVKNKNLHSPSNFFIFSLCISDLISGLICSPLWLYRRTWGFCCWEWGEAWCKFYWFLDFATNYTTAMHILSFALLRCFAVHWPFRISSITKRRVAIYICVIWAIAVVMSFPLFYLMGVVPQRSKQKIGSPHWPSCSICSQSNIDNNRGCVSAYNTYMLVVSSIFFYVPEVCVIALSFCIARALIRRKRWRKRASSVYTVSESLPGKRQLNLANIQDVEPDNETNNEESDDGLDHSKTRHQPSFYAGPTHFDLYATAQKKPKNTAIYRGYLAQNERNIFTQLSLIVVAFMIGYIPSTIYLVWTTATNGSTEGIDGKLDYWFGVASYLCLRLSECMNPIMYNLGSSNIRKATKNLFKRNK